MLKADFEVIRSASDRMRAAIQYCNFGGTLFPSFEGYSPVPSLQTLGTEHSRAIHNAHGSSELVTNAFLTELDWATQNLNSLSRTIQVFENNFGDSLKHLSPEKRLENRTMSYNAITETLSRRPDFNPGSLSFTPPSLSTEPDMGVDELLAAFTATDNGAIQKASDYWRNYQQTMTTIADELTDITDTINANNHGEVFYAVTHTLAKYSNQATNISQSANVFSSHLDTLPSVKNMAINHLEAINAQSKQLNSPGVKRAFEQDEIRSFLSGPYLTELHAAIPTIPHLVAPNGSAAADETIATHVPVQYSASRRSIHDLTPTTTAGTTESASTTPTTNAVLTPNNVNANGAGIAPNQGTNAPPATPTANGNSPISTASITAPRSASSGATVPQSNTRFPDTAPSSVSAPGSDSINTGRSQSAPIMNAIAPVTTKSNSSNPALQQQRIAPPPGTHRINTTNGLHHLPTNRPSGNPSAISRPNNSAARLPLTNNQQPLTRVSTPNGFISFEPKAPYSGLKVPSSFSGTGSGAATGTGGHTTYPRVGAVDQRTTSAFGAAMNRGSAAKSANDSSISGTARNTSGTVGTLGTLGHGRGLQLRKPDPRVATIANHANSFEQNEHQLALFGIAPPTVPAIIGTNVKE